MNKPSFSLKRQVLTFAAVLTGVPMAHSANGTWYSTNSVYGNASWTNSYNWSAQPFPSGNQTATFSNSGNGRTTVDVTGSPLVSNIVFDTSSAAAYTIGSNGVNQQTLILSPTNGNIQVTSSSLNSQRFNAKVQLGFDRSAGYFTFRNDHLFNVLTFAGDIPVPNSGGAAGGKALTVAGSGSVLISGNIMTNGVDALTVTNATLGTLAITGAGRFSTLTLNSGSTVLSGTNRIGTVNVNSNCVLNLSGSNVLSTLNINGTGDTAINIVSGYMAFENGGGQTMVANQDAVINGPGVIVLPAGPSSNPTGDNYAGAGKTLTINANMTGPAGLELWSGTGTYVLGGANSFTGNVSMGPAGTLSIAKIGNKGSTNSNLGRGTTLTLGGNGTRLLYTGTGETSDRILTINNTSIIIDNSGTGHLNLTAPLSVTSGSRALTLQGSTTGTAEFSGLLRNDSGTLTVTKAGSGTWLFTTNNTYSGTTTVSGGTLALSGASGAIGSSTAYVISAGATLLLDNTTAANNTNRLSDTSAIALNGGTLSFSHDSGDANFSENAGAVTISQTGNTIATAQAASGKTATLRFTSLTRTAGATINFTGTGLGESDRNRLFISAQPDGLMGPLATVNGTQRAAYSSTLGVHAAGSAEFADISALGVSTITNDATRHVRINSVGDSGPIELGADTTQIASLLQNTATEATINTAGKALQTGAIIVPSGRAAVKVGAAANDGVLAPLDVNGDLILSSGAANGLTVNAVLADAGAASKLTKSDEGAAILAGTNTFGGTVSILGGALILANGNALQNASLTTAGTVFDSSVADHAFTLGALSGSFPLALDDNAGSPNAVGLTVGNNNANTTFGGALSGAGSLTKTGNGTLTLAGASSYLGGTTVSAGTLAVTNAGGLGTGSVENKATLNLLAGAAAYTGLSTALTGTGTVNVALGTGSSTVLLNGDYSGFTGIWNIGLGALAGAGKVQMNGPLSDAATINVLSNGTFFCNTPGTRGNSVSLGGGDTGEAYGQIRLEGNAEWSGPVLLAGNMATNNDGYVGCSTGAGKISGVISDGGAGYTLDKVGGGTLYLTGNNTYGGPTWIKGGTVGVSTIGTVGGGSGPLGAASTPEGSTIKLGFGGTSGTLLYTGMGETTDRTIDLAGTTGAGYIDQSGTNVLTLAGDVISSGVGNKQLRLQGSTIGTAVLSGVFYDNGTSSTNNLWKTGTNTWTLAANNQFKGNVVVENGALVLKRSEALGNWPKTAQAANNAGGANPHIHLDGSEGDLVIPEPITFRTSNSRVGAIMNEAGNNTILGMIHLTSGDGDTILRSNAGKLTVMGKVYPPSDTSRQLRLWGDGDGEIAGMISNGLTVNMPVYRDMGTGTWTLSGSNTYSGSTYVNAGTLVIGGSNGFIQGALSINGGTLVIANSAISNSPSRLNDSAAVTMNGGIFDFSHTGGATNYGETAGTLTVNSGSNTIAASQADVGYTSIVTFAALARNIGSVNFVGAGLGTDERNEIRFATPPTTGLLGLWATYNGTNQAAYDSARGVVAAAPELFTGIPAKGPYTIASDGTLNAQITNEGTGGPVSLAGTPTSSLKTLMQNSGWASTIAMTNQTLQVSDVMISEGKEALTIGSAENEGAVVPLTAGGTITLINNSANTLTVNAPISNNTSASSLVKLGAGTVTLCGTNSYTGPTLIGEGALEYSGGGTQTISGVISGPGGLVKSGPGRLFLSAMNAYLGQTTVKAGTLMLYTNTALGSAAAGTVVESGATLDVGGCTGGNGLNLGDEVITVSGSGVNGRGAVINSSNNNQNNAFRYITLADDTTFGGEQVNGRWDIRNTPTAATLTMNDHNVTKVGANTVGLTSITVLPGSGNIEVKEGTLTVETSTAMNGSSANTLTVQNGAVFDFYRIGTPITWSLILNAGGHLNTRSNNGGSQNVWAGPVTLNGQAFIDGAAGTTNVLCGNVTGTGSLLKTGSVSYVFMLTGSNNTYSGGTVITNGILYAQYPGSLPGYAAGKVALSGSGTLAVPTGDGTNGWSADQIQALHDASAFASSASTLSIDTMQAGMTYPYDLTKKFSIAKNGTNTLTLAGINRFTGAVTVNNGTLVLGGSASNNVGAITVNNAATMAISNTFKNVTGAIVVNGAATLNVCASSTNAIGAVTLNGGLLDFDTGSTNVGSGTITIKGGAAGARLNIDGAVNIGMTANNIVPGAGANDRSTVRSTSDIMCYGIRMCEGTAPMSAAFYNDGGSIRATRLLLSVTSGNTYSYYRHNGGTATISEFLEIGVYGVGVMDVLSGTIAPYGTAMASISRRAGSTGLLNVFGGTVNAPNNGNAFEMSRSGDGSNPNAQLNVFDSGVVNAAAGTGTTKIMDMNVGTTDNCLSVINLLNGGTLIANKIGSTRQGDRRVNFDGGVLRAASGTTVGATFLQGLTAATVYSGGLTLDTSSANITINQNLLAPTDYGVGSVSLQRGGQGYMGAPIVVISGGSGTGATAIATVDLNPASPTAGQVTGVTVTSPGTGYQAGDVVLVSFRSGGYTNNTPALAYPATLALNATSGGLTKAGSGTLTLGGTNTYAGATVISNGTLRLAHADVLPPYAPVTLTGGTLDLGGATVTCDVSCVSGAISNGTLYTVISPAGTNVVGTEMFPITTANLQGVYLADAATSGDCDFLTVPGDVNITGLALEIVNPNLLNREKTYTIATFTGARTGTFSATNLPDSRWHLFYGVDGTIKLIFVDGTILLLK